MIEFLIFLCGIAFAALVGLIKVVTSKAPHRHSIQLDDETTIVIIHSHKAGRTVDISKTEKTEKGIFIPYGENSQQ